jgi:hypothetical protein
MKIILIFLFQREIQTLREKLRKAKTSTDVATAEQVCKTYRSYQSLIKGIQDVRIEFFVYTKSCQYSMFYTNCS